jgi:hypothetical protein
MVTMGTLTSPSAPIDAIIDSGEVLVKHILPQRLKDISRQLDHSLAPAIRQLCTSTNQATWQR